MNNNNTISLSIEKVNFNSDTHSRKLNCIIDIKVRIEYHLITRLNRKFKNKFQIAMGSNYRENELVGIN